MELEEYESFQTFDKNMIKVIGKRKRSSWPKTATMWFQTGYSILISFIGNLSISAFYNLVIAALVGVMYETLSGTTSTLRNVINNNFDNELQSRVTDSQPTISANAHNYSMTGLLRMLNSRNTRF